MVHAHFFYLRVSTVQFHGERAVLFSLRGKRGAVSRYTRIFHLWVNTVQFHGTHAVFSHLRVNTTQFHSTRAFFIYG
jgi:hypothetical protein